MSLIDLSNLSKSVDTLIKKISNATGILFEPRQIRRIAKAKADAALTEAESEIQITDLHRRAVRRWIEEEAQYQNNIEQITSKAIPQLNEDGNPDSMEDDWITNFFDKARIVSDDEMQMLWACVLAGEANRPGTYSKRTVNFLSDLDKSDAKLFSKLCGFAWYSGFAWNIGLFIFDEKGEIYNREGVDFRTLTDLDSIGLIQFNPLAGFTHLQLPKRFTLSYYGRPLVLEMSKETDNELDTGKVLLTKIGRELAPICGSKSVDGFWEYVKDRWKQYLPK